MPEVPPGKRSSASLNVPSGKPRPTTPKTDHCPNQTSDSSPIKEKLRPLTNDCPSIFFMVTGNYWSFSGSGSNYGDFEAPSCWKNKGVIVSYTARYETTWRTSNKGDTGSGQAPKLGQTGVTVDDNERLPESTEGCHCQTDMSAGYVVGDGETKPPVTVTLLKLANGYRRADYSGRVMANPMNVMGYTARTGYKVTDLAGCGYTL